MQIEDLRGYLLDAIARRPIWDLTMIGADNEVREASTKFALILVAERRSIPLDTLFEQLPDYVNDPRAQRVRCEQLKAHIVGSGRVDAMKMSHCGSDRRRLLLLAEDHGIQLEEFLATAEQMADYVNDPRAQRVPWGAEVIHR